jgi:hypothetical protein
MIRYALSCKDSHAFESWFKSAAAFDGLAAAGHVTCPVCGTAEVTKSLMAPAVAHAAKPAAPTLTEPANPMEEAMRALRRQVEENSEYVGVNFVTEARRIHDGDAPERAIYGEARPEDAKRLIEDGVPVAPLPFFPARKTN